jgi:hypothetical protein
MWLYVPGDKLLGIVVLLLVNVLACSDGGWSSGKGWLNIDG